MMNFIKNLLMIVGIAAVAALINEWRKGPLEKAGEKMETGFRRVGQSFHETS